MFMKHICTSFLLLATFQCLAQEASPTASVQRTTPKPDIKLGLEGVTTWRSEYVYRGLKLADQTLEFQLSGEAVINEYDSVAFGAFYGTATGSQGFEELSGYLEFSRRIGDWMFTGGINAKNYLHTALNSGVEFNLSANYVLNEQFDFTGLLSYDTGAEGVYAEFKTSFYQEISDSAFLIVDSGISAVGDYYEESGFNHFFTRLSFTYNLTDAVSISPFAELSIGLNDNIGDHTLSGFYFAVAF